MGDRLDPAHQLSYIFSFYRVSLHVHVFEHFSGFLRGGDENLFGVEVDGAAFDLDDNFVSVKETEEVVEGAVRFSEIVEDSDRLIVVAVEPLQARS